MTGRILVADDSQPIRDLLQMSLETLGYTVVLAEDGERAMQAIDEARPDLLIVDVMMPKLNGFQICRKVKNNPATQRTPVILLTARVQEEDIFWGRDCGADEYITKPFKTAELQKSVERLMRSQRQKRGREGRDTQPFRDKRQPAGETQIVMMRWDPRAMDVFRKKYGEIRFSEVLQGLRRAAEQFVEKRRFRGPVGVHVPFGLSVVIDGSAAAALQSARDLVQTLDALALKYYEDVDRNRGHIRYRDPRSGLTERMPLLTFTAKIDPDTHV